MASNHCTVAVALVSVNQAPRVLLDVVVLVLVVVAVSIHHLHCRRVVQTYPDRVRLVLSEACRAAVLCTREVSVGCELQPREELVVDVELNRVALRLSVANNTFLVHIVGREICLCAGCTLRDSHLVVLCNTGVEQLVHPVDTLVCAVDITSESVSVSTLVLHQSLCVILSVHSFRNVVCVRNTERSVKCNLSCAGLTHLGLNHYNTVSTARTVDSCRRSVLQHLDALNILRVDTLETCLANDAVNYVQRVVALVYRACTTHTNLHRTARNARRHYLHTRHTTVEGVLNTCYRLVLKRLAIHDGYRTCQVGLLHCTVTDNDNVAQHLGILMKSNVKGLLACYRHFLSLIAYVRNYNCGF